MFSEDTLFTSLQFKEAYKNLTTKQRIVVALKFMGFNYRESGQILGLTRQAVGSIFNRARLQIVEEMTDSG